MIPLRRSSLVFEPYRKKYATKASMNYCTDIAFVRIKYKGYNVHATTVYCITISGRRSLRKFVLNSNIVSSRKFVLHNS